MTTEGLSAVRERGEFLTAGMILLGLVLALLI